MGTRFAVGLMALGVAGCATVSPPPAAVESPAPKAAQVAAQENQAPVAPRYKRKVAIGRFTNETNYGRSLLTDADLDRLGKQAADMLASRLVMSGEFIVLERPDLAKVEREQAISGGAKVVGADTLIVGSVTEFGRATRGKVGFLSSTKLQVAEAKVDVRLVDVKTGHAFFSALGAGEATSESGEVAGFGSRAQYDATLNDRAIAAAVSDVVDRLVSRLQARPWQTDILDVRGDQVFIGGGKAQGVREGDVLAVMERGNTVKSAQSGFDVTLPPTRVATLKVLSTFGESETNEGAICAVTRGSVDKARLEALFVAEPPRDGTP
jgi:curli biogenesis system outer membrane secretion channel CsgG